MENERVINQQLTRDLADVRRQLQFVQAAQRIKDAALGMEGSKDLPRVTSVFFQEIVGLGITDPGRAEGITIALVDEEGNRILVHSAFGHVQLLGGTFTRKEVPSMHGGEPMVLREISPEIVAYEDSGPLTPEDKERWLRGDPWQGEIFRERAELESAFREFGITAPPDAMEGILRANEGRVVTTCNPFQHGWTNLTTHEEPDEAKVAAVHQLTEAFSLGYIRHLDFQRLEDQAKSLQMQTAQLKRERAAERVRAEAMAMRTTEDLINVVTAMFQEMVTGGVLDPTRAEAVSIWLFSPESDRQTHYAAIENPSKHGVTFTTSRFVSVDEDIAVYRFQTPFGEAQDDIVAQWREGSPSERILGMTREVLEEDLRVHGASGPAQALEHLVTKRLGQEVRTSIPFEHGLVELAQRENRAEHVPFVQHLTAAFALGYQRFLDLERTEQAQRQLIDDLEDELQTAHDMQMDLMPTGSPDVVGISVTGRCVSANHVGGDFFQYFEQGASITISLADVTGHAMEAAIPAVMFSGVLDKQMEIPTTLEERFSGLNRSMCRSLGEHTYVCLSMVEIESGTHAMRLSNCGCPYPLHCHAATGDISEWRIDAYPLGIRQDTVYAEKEGTLQPGDYLLLYSDGFPEAANATGDMFGFEHTAEVIRAGCSEGLSPEELIDRLIAEVKAFTGDEPQADDMTCVVVKVEA